MWRTICSVAGDAPGGISLLQPKYTVPYGRPLHNPATDMKSIFQHQNFSCIELLEVGMRHDTKVVLNKSRYHVITANLRQKVNITHPSCSISVVLFHTVRFEHTCR